MILFVTAPYVQVLREHRSSLPVPSLWKIVVFCSFVLLVCFNCLPPSARCLLNSHHGDYDLVEHPRSSPRPASDADSAILVKLEAIPTGSQRSTSNEPRCRSLLPESRTASVLPPTYDHRPFADVHHLTCAHPQILRYTSARLHSHQERTRHLRFQNAKRLFAYFWNEKPNYDYDRTHVSC